MNFGFWNWIFIGIFIRINDFISISCSEYIIQYIGVEKYVGVKNNWVVYFSVYEIICLVIDCLEFIIYGFFMFLVY